MDVQLNIDPAELAKNITNALTSTAFSEMFKTAVEEELNEITKSTYNSNSVMRRVIKNFFEVQMRKVLEEEYTEKAKIMILQKFESDGKLDEMADKLLSRIKLNDY